MPLLRPWQLARTTIGAVALRETPVIEALKQGRNVGNVADRESERIQADVLLEYGAHPFERGLPSLCALVRLRSDANHATGIAEELFYAFGGDDRRIGAGKQI
jgi:hypothetical protein